MSDEPKQRKGGPLPMGDLGRLPSSRALLTKKAINEVVEQTAAAVIQALEEESQHAPKDSPLALLAPARRRKTPEEVQAEYRAKMAAREAVITKRRLAAEQATADKAAGLRRPQIPPGEFVPGKKLHGAALRDVRQRTYTSWHNMLMRCYNPKHVSYSEYGGRGIQVFVGWIPRDLKLVADIADKRGMQLSYAAAYNQFVADVGLKPTPTHTLDRIDPNGHYVPSNVKWATPLEQGINKRETHHIYHPITGVKVPAATVAREAGISYQLLRARMVKQGTWYAVALDEQPSSKTVQPPGTAPTATDVANKGEAENDSEEVVIQEGEINDHDSDI